MLQGILHRSLQLSPSSITIATKRSHIRMSAASADNCNNAKVAPDGPPKALLHCDWIMKDRWAEGIRSAGVDLAVWPDVPDYSAIELFIGWNPPKDIFTQLTNLKAVQLLGAGVDSVIHNPDIPPSVPLLRIADPLMGQRLANWVIWAVLNKQRGFDRYAELQRQKKWDKEGVEAYDNRDNHEVHVGIMGLGVMGSATAESLVALGYSVSAWTRSPREHARVTCYNGQDSLQEFVAQCEFLVCLLPLTPDTEGIVNAELLSWLPDGATFINGARGKHMVETDVLAALDSGKLAHLVTDVTHPEPLPAESRLWDHPAVRLTPHVAAFTPVPTASQQIAENYRALLAGEELARERVVDRAAGY